MMPMSILTQESVLDARYLEPPEPMVLALRELENLAQGHRLRLLLDREPYPFYGLLRDAGWQYDSRLFDDGHVEVLIWR
jgi:uncharacterized protein (DUF2249 family)